MPSLHQRSPLLNGTKVQSLASRLGLPDDWSLTDNLKLMLFEKFDLENLDKEHRKAIAKSIRTITLKN
jgi:hypothetical protein